MVAKDVRASDEEALPTVWRMKLKPRKIVSQLVLADSDVLRKVGGSTGEHPWTFAQVQEAKVFLLIELQLHYVSEPPQIIRVSEAPDELHEGFFVRTVELELEDNEELVGFRWNVSGENYYRPYALVRSYKGCNGNEKELRLEPLSRISIEAIQFENEQWMPPEANPKNRETCDRCALAGLRFTNGEDHDAVIGALYCDLEGASWSEKVRAFTGQAPMFWSDLLMLTFAAFYLDIVTDLNQMTFFWNQHLHDYFWANGVGIAIPIIYSVVETLEYFGTGDVNIFCNRFKTFGCLAQALMVLIVLCQGHVLLLTLESALMRRKHSVLKDAKQAEVLESAVSAMVQMNFLVLAISGVHPMSDGLSAKDLSSMGFSILLSCCLLGLSYATKDKKETTVLGLPGKLADWGLQLGVVLAARICEVTSRIAAINIIHASTRSTMTVGAFVVVGALVGANCAAFPKARTAECLAGVFGHPGQLLEPASLMPLGRSLCIHVVLVALAAVSQALVHFEVSWAIQLFPYAAAVPLEVLLPCAVLTSLAFAGLGLASWLGGPLPASFLPSGTSPKDQNYRQLLGNIAPGESVLSESVLAALKAHDACLEIDAAAVTGFGKDSVKKKQRRWKAIADSGVRTRLLLSGMQVPSEGAPVVPGTSFDLVDLSRAQLGDDTWVKAIGQSSVFRLNMSQCELAEETWEAMLQVLSDCRLLQQLNLAQCSRILEEAWQQLADVEWHSMKKATFTECFCVSSAGSGALLRALSRCQVLEELNMASCRKIPEEAWRQLGHAKWLSMKKAIFTECFCVSGVGSGALLQVLSRCRHLEELNMAGCCRIPEEAWQQLGHAGWHSMKKATFTGCFEYSGMGSGALLQFLSLCRQLEELNMGECDHIPEEAWRELSDNCWPALRNFDGVPKEHLARLTGRAEKARENVGIAEPEERNVEADKVQAEQGQDEKCSITSLWPRFLLAAFPSTSPQHLQDLSRCQGLEELNMAGCDRIPEEAWRQLHNAAWHSVKKATFTGCFKHSGAGSGALLQVLSRCRRLEDLNMASCSQVPVEAWQQLGHAEWHSMKKATFTECFYFSGSGSGGLLRVLSRCRHLEELNMAGCHRIAKEAWQQLGGAEWHTMKKATFTGCFEYYGVGSGAVLQVLSRCRHLEELNMVDCRAIAEEAWQQLGNAHWHSMKKATFTKCFEHSGGGSGALLQVLSHCQHLEELNLAQCSQISERAWQQLGHAEWLSMRKASFTGCFHGSGAGSGALLHALSRCQHLEELNMAYCCRIPAEAWQQLDHAEWHSMKKATFTECFFISGAGSGALLQILSRCQHLEELSMAGCRRIPEEAWQQLRHAEWHTIKKVSLTGCFHASGEGSGALLQVLSCCQHLEELILDDCDQVAEEAWQELPDNCWPVLREATGVPRKTLSRLRGGLTH